MRIAIPCDNNHCVSEHFGKCAQVIIYDVRYKEMLHREHHQFDGSRALVDFMKDNSVSAILCNKIHNDAVDKLLLIGIEAIGGIDGDPDACANTFIEGKLPVSTKSCTAENSDCTMCLS